jgi:probable F420-dependent oxidoreductase
LEKVLILDPQNRFAFHNTIAVMKFGISLSGLSARHYPEVAAEAEAVGFESLWMPEHLVFPVEMPPEYSYTEDGYPPMNSRLPTFDPWVVLGAVASRTESIRLATGVYILPLRHPIKVARSVVTLDRMSGGRVVLGIGVGWLSDEFDIVGERFRDRGRRTDEMIELMRRLWSEEVIEHHGEFYDIPPIYFEPKPLRGAAGIPFIVGGTSPGALRRAGRLGDGWIHHRQVFAVPEDHAEDDWVELESHLATIDAHREEVGRSDLEFEVVAGMGSDYDSIRRCDELGVTLCNVGPAPSGLRGTREDFVDWIHQFGHDVMTRF